jgi:hypothetical protein
MKPRSLWVTFYDFTAEISRIKAGGMRTANVKKQSIAKGTAAIFFRATKTCLGTAKL